MHCNYCGVREVYEMMVDMKGFVEYEDKQYPFSFSDSTLNLYPDKFDSKSIEEWFTPYERGEVIENIQLHGITANRKNVIFEVLNNILIKKDFYHLMCILFLNMIQHVISLILRMENINIT